VQSAQILKQKINSGQPTLGAMATFHLWHGAVELARRCGLDYLIVDLEHLEHPSDRVADVCAIGRLLDFPVLIRPAAAELVRMRLAADLGPCGMLLPYVESTAVLDEVQDALYMKPRGKRRPGGPGNRWVTGYNYETFKIEVEDDWVILPQIESRAGLANVEAIARHPLVTAMAIGPYDLSADLGVCWRPEDPRLIAAQETIRAAARAAGKNMWNIGDAATLAQRGYTFLCVGELMATLETALTGLAAQTRSAAGLAGKAAAPRP
jgi:2-keto-3-deoxy-L-rhamnonate aldolase RhmA